MGILGSILSAAGMGVVNFFRPAPIVGQIEGPTALMPDDVELDLPEEGEEFQVPPGRIKYYI